MFHYQKKRKMNRKFAVLFSLMEVMLVIKLMNALMDMERDNVFLHTTL